MNFGANEIHSPIYIRLCSIPCMIPMNNLKRKVSGSSPTNTVRWSMLHLIFMFQYYGLPLPYTLQASIQELVRFTPCASKIVDAHLVSMFQCDLPLPYILYRLVYRSQCGLSRVHQRQRMTIPLSQIYIYIKSLY